MLARRERRRYAGFFLILVFAFCLCNPLMQVIGSASAVDNEQRTKLTAGQQNIVKRAYQMTDISWTPRQDVIGWNNEFIYRAGTTYVGLPYGQPVYASYVPWSVDLNGFLDAVNNSDSLMYTDCSSYEAIAPYYSTDCSAFVSWAWGLPGRQTTGTIKNFATQISTTSYADAQVGDCLCLAGTHVVLITDITYDENGTINSIEISEATVNSANYCCHKVRYGVGGKHTLESFVSYYFEKGYILYRSNTREDVTYSHSCAISLDGDVCTACDLGIYEEIPVNFVVAGTEDIVLYALPDMGADQLGIIYAGNEIVIVAYSEDKNGALWYKTADKEWLLASKTKQICNHDYLCDITTSPSCTEEGQITYTCNLCGDSYVQGLDSLGHSYDTAVIPPNCNIGGYEEHRCLLCGDTYRNAETPAAGHSYENGICTVCCTEAYAVQKGDLDNDGEITSADSVLLARYLVDLQVLSWNQLQAADINGDGEITSADSVLLARHLAGLTEIN